MNISAGEDRSYISILQQKDYAIIQELRGADGGRVAGSVAAGDERAEEVFRFFPLDGNVVDLVMAYDFKWDFIHIGNGSCSIP